MCVYFCVCVLYVFLSRSGECVCVNWTFCFFVCVCVCVNILFLNLNLVFTVHWSEVCLQCINYHAPLLCMELQCNMGSQPVSLSLKLCMWQASLLCSLWGDCVLCQDWQNCPQKFFFLFLKKVEAEWFFSVQFSVCVQHYWRSLTAPTWNGQRESRTFLPAQRS